MAELMSKTGMDVHGEYVRIGDVVKVEMGVVTGDILAIVGFMPASYSNQTVAILRNYEGKEYRFITRILKKQKVTWND
ncbi:hypothetical protein NVP1293O_53 [Vibrio phage 1.293.O._10N.261.52.E1]|nr:hypothetical protein NVP1293O_53 [Vibrio phage 1.293.O._10N.261.52.E1]